MINTIIDKANFLIQSDVSIHILEKRLNINLSNVNSVRNGTHTFDSLSLAEIKILAQYYDIYGPNEIVFTKHKAFLYHYVANHNYFTNGDLAIYCLDDTSKQHLIYHVHITDTHTFIDSIIHQYPFYQLLTELANLSQVEFDRCLQRFFICNIADLLKLTTLGFKLIPAIPSTSNKYN